MFENSEIKRINRLILSGGGGMTENRFFAAEIKDWLAGKKASSLLISGLKCLASAGCAMCPIITVCAPCPIKSR